MEENKRNISLEELEEIINEMKGYKSDDIGEELTKQKEADPSEELNRMLVEEVEGNTHYDYGVDQLSDTDRLYEMFQDYQRLSDKIIALQELKAKELDDLKERLLTAYKQTLTEQPVVHPLRSYQVRQFIEEIYPDVKRLAK